MGELSNEDILLISASVIFGLYVIYHGFKDNKILFVIFTLMMVFVSVASNRQLFNTEAYVSIQTIIYVMAFLGLVQIGYDMYTGVKVNDLTLQERVKLYKENRAARAENRKARYAGFGQNVPPNRGFNAVAM